MWFIPVTLLQNQFIPGVYVCMCVCVLGRMGVLNALHTVFIMDSDSWTSYGHMDLRDVPINCYGHSAIKGLVNNSQMHSEMK